MRKRYKTVVINGRKVKRNAIILLLCVSVIILGSNIIGGYNSTDLPIEIMKQTLPVIGASEGRPSQIKRGAKRVATETQKILVSFNPFNVCDILSSQMPALRTISESGLVRLSLAERGDNTVPVPTATEAQKNIDAENLGDIKAIDASPKDSDTAKITIGNQTSYPINIGEMLVSPLNLNFDGDGPKILIVHTHTTEAYSPEGAEVYNREESDRSNDPNVNVVKIGNVIAESLNNRGIETLHSDKIHDQPSFNGAYASSLKTVEEYLEKYPSIQMVLDIHRDSIVYDDGTKAKTVTEIDGEQTAQLMFVVGTDEGGLYHPNWQENMKFAIKLQNAINKRYPKLMRYINLRKERFNGHTTRASIIVEVGTSGNSLSEAVNGAERFSECLADFLIN